jgi:LCP family protein required for cell wall assembly
MKGFLKAFLASFIGFTVLFSAVFIGADHFIFNGKSDGGSSQANAGEGENIKSEDLDQYIKDKKRLNILLIGADGGRSDTMMVMSVGLSDKSIRLLSVPRDTYYHLEGYDAYDQRKLNAVYGHGEEKGGAKGVNKAVADITHLSIPYYVEVNYDAVMEIVDLVGGVEYDVPFDMNYDDPYAKPPLHIHLKKGQQVLDGEKAIQFLRWRKNNGTEGTGDIDRMKRQQDFMMAAARKAFGLKLPKVIKAAYENVNTNLGVQEMLFIGTKMLGTDLSKIEKHTLPGKLDMKKGYSYLVPDDEAIKTLMLTFDKIDEKVAEKK